MTQIARYKDGQSLAYAEYGDRNGYPVLIQHGLIASIDDGYLFQPLIQAGRRLISIARPGYGASSPYPLAAMAEWAEMVSAVVDPLGLAQFDVLGMSSGAPYAYALGCAFPHRVRNIYIYSGIPALYDPDIRSQWPFALDLHATLAELEHLANQLFFSNLSAADLQTSAIRDSMRNHAFGLALDFWLRCRDWGFTLSEVKAPVHMQHSRRDAGVPLVTAELTAKRLPQCTLAIKDTDVHFSPEALAEFFRAAMIGLAEN